MESAGVTKPQPERATTKVIRKQLPRFEARTIFDVGANIGQSAREFGADFPHARIHSFEPVESTFRMAQENCAALPNVTLHNLGLGRTAGEIRMTSVPGSVSNRAAADGERRQTTAVRIVTGDAFCAEHGVATIDYLKIDTEGLDLQVLLGFIDMLATQRIALVEVEVGMNPHNQRHVPFETIKSFLAPLGYHMFYVFSLAHDTKFSGRPVLRRANVVFISEPTVSANESKRPD